MDISVEEGRLIETATPGATGMERRAFGEFVSPRGEMASYAFGWATDADPRVGRLSVGIGVGNPGGATFHAVIHDHEGRHGFSLVDEPFADVTQGGPDLSAAAAREHDDLEFVWWVADEVMARDRRALWLWHWLAGTPAVQTPEVFALSEAVLLVSHDAEDDVWQLIGTSDAHDDPKIGHLYHAVDEDPTLIDVLDLEPGERAERDCRGGEWVRS
jgi:hypothetical protein